MIAIEFWRSVASKLKQAGYIDTDFDDEQVGLLPFGGDNLSHWIQSGAVHKLTRAFGVVVDSDRKSRQYSIPGGKLNWKNACEGAGSVFFILKKREIVNYLHPDAIVRAGYELYPRLASGLAVGKYRLSSKPPRGSSAGR